MWRTYLIKFTGISYPEPKRYRPDMTILWADFGLSIAAVGDDLLCPPSAQRISEYYFLFFFGLGVVVGGRDEGFVGIERPFYIFPLFPFSFFLSQSNLASRIDQKYFITLYFFRIFFGFWGKHVVRGQREEKVAGLSFEFSCYASAVWSPKVFKRFF